MSFRFWDWPKTFNPQKYQYDREYFWRNVLGFNGQAKE